MPRQTKLEMAYPNPFNPAASIAYDLKEDGYVSLTVYNMLGQEVATLIDGMEKAGSYTVQFDGSRLASGTYFCRMSADGYTKVMKLMLTR